jgi:hypothetical protein
MIKAQALEQPATVPAGYQHQREQKRETHPEDQADSQFIEDQQSIHQNNWILTPAIALYTTGQFNKTSAANLVNC